MDWITNTIAIGNYLDAQDAGLLSKEKITSILSLDETLVGIVPRELGVKRIEIRRLTDGPGNNAQFFVSTVHALQRLVVEAPPVMVQCHAGRSRSVIVVAGFLMSSLGITPKEAIAMVAKKREVAITPGIEKLLSYVT